MISLSVDDFGFDDCSLAEFDSLLLVKVQPHVLVDGPALGGVDDCPEIQGLQSRISTIILCLEAFVHDEHCP